MIKNLNKLLLSLAAAYTLTPCITYAADLVGTESVNDASLSSSQDGSATVISSSGINNATIGPNRGIIINSNPDGIGSNESFEIFDNGQNVMKAVGGSYTSVTGANTTLKLDNNGATFSTTSNAAVQVHGVADGTSAYDAVNYQQLYQAEQQFNNSLAQTEQQFSNSLTQVEQRFNNSLIQAEQRIDYKLQQTEKKLSGGVAMAGAFAGIPQVDPGKKLSLGAGYGYYNTENALAVGGSIRVANNGIVKTGVAITSGDASVSAGFGYSW